MLLAEGRLVFRGHPSDAAPAFDSLGLPCPEGMSPADHMLMSVGDPESLMTLMQRLNGLDPPPPPQKQQQQQCVIDKADLDMSNAQNKTTEHSSWTCAFSFRKSGVLLWCSMASLLRNPALLLMHYVGAAVMGLLVGFVFYKIQVETTAGETHLQY